MRVGYGKSPANGKIPINRAPDFFSTEFAEAAEKTFKDFLCVLCALRGV